MRFNEESPDRTAARLLAERAERIIARHFWNAAIDAAVDEAEKALKAGEPVVDAIHAIRTEEA